MLLTCRIGMDGDRSRSVTGLERTQSNSHMGIIEATTQKASVLRHVGKSVALAASTGAALISVFSALYSYGVVGKSESHQSIGNIGAAWVGLRPAVDTATAIGDTIHYAATIADKNGSILVGARPVWTTGDSTVAKVLPDGSVIARGQGATTVSVVVGKLVANSRIIVRQRVATVDVGNVPGDSAVVLHEGSELQLRARAFDSRGHLVAGRAAEWQVDDTSVAGLGKDGMLSAHNAGRTLVSAKVDGATGKTGVAVITKAAAIALVAGTNQRALAGGTLAQAVVVRATNRRGGPAPGQVVNFRIADGQGSVEPRTATTDADGRARATWTLGDYPGRQTLLATVDKVDSTLAIVAEADPIASNTRVAAHGEREQLSARAGEQLADSIAVRVTDSTGRALADVPVRWMADDGGSADAIAPRTDSLGLAWTRWTLGRKTGTQRLRAHVGGGSGGRSIPPVTISALALAGAPTGIVVVSGDDQRGMAGAALSKPVTLKVVDANGSGVAAASLVLSPSAGTIADSTLQTDSLGMVRVRWTMGRSAGDHALGVHVDGLKKAHKVAARAIPASPANLSFDDAPPPAGEKHHAKEKGRHLYAVVTDIYGNPVPDAKVSFSTKSGMVTPARAVSDARGRAALTWTPGTKPGEQMLTGVVRGTDVKGTFATQVAGHDAPPKAATPAKASTAKSVSAKASSRPKK